MTLRTQIDKEGEGKTAVVVGNGDIRIAAMNSSKKIDQIDALIGSRQFSVSDSWKSLQNENRIIELKQFIIHEIMKSFVKSPTEWANRVLLASISDLGLDMTQQKLIKNETINFERLDDLLDAKAIYNLAKHFNCSKQFIDKIESSLVLLELGK
jgi:hypothetical protein